MANRRERRWALKQRGFLKIKNMYNRFSPIAVQWYSTRAEEGRMIHNNNTEAVEKAQYDSLLNREQKQRELYTELGYNEAELEMVLEAWRLTTVKNPESRRADKKEARRLQKEAQASFLARTK